MNKYFDKVDIVTVILVISVVVEDWVFVKMLDLGHPGKSPRETPRGDS